MKLSAKEAIRLQGIMTHSSKKVYSRHRAPFVLASWERYGKGT